jgi:hypothetical protein
MIRAGFGSFRPARNTAAWVQPCSDARKEASGAVYIGSGRLIATSHRIALPASLEMTAETLECSMLSTTSFAHKPLGELHEVIGNALCLYLPVRAIA